MLRSSKVYALMVTKPETGAASAVVTSDSRAFLAERLASVWVKAEAEGAKVERVENGGVAFDHPTGGLSIMRIVETLHIDTGEPD